MTTASALPRPSRASLLRVVPTVDTTLILTFVCLLFTEVSVGIPRYVVYDVTWAIVGLQALFDTDMAPASTTAKREAVAVAVDYFALLTVIGNSVTSPMSGDANSVHIALPPPGWDPVSAYGSDPFSLVFMSTYVVGYTALVFLVCDTVVKMAGTAVSGIVDLFSYVSYSWSVLMSIATSVFGGGTAVTATVTTLSYGLLTLVFPVTVLLLRWRPGFGTSQ